MEKGFDGGEMLKLKALPVLSEFGLGSGSVMVYCDKEQRFVETKVGYVSRMMLG